MVRRSKASDVSNVEGAEDLLQKMAEQDSDVMLFEVKRDGPPEPGRTFSLEALAGLRDNMGLFVGARVMRHWKDRGTDRPGPSRLEVAVSVKIDGVQETVTLDLLPWYSVTDGDRRGGGLH